MSLRSTTRQKGANDYSNLGVSGRRTGLVLPQGRLDNNGIEEISGIFSSPRKPSPLKNVSNARGTQEDHEDIVTPKQPRSARRARPARSASPRKSGISGAARRSNALDILKQNSIKGNKILEAKDSGKSSSPVPRSNARSFSPATSTLRKNQTDLRSAQQLATESDDQVSRSRRHSSVSSNESSDQPVMGSGRRVSEQRRSLDFAQHKGLPDAPRLDFDSAAPLYDDSDEGQPIEPAKSSRRGTREPMTANSTRKRKSDVVDTDHEPDVVSSPAAKRAKRISDENIQRSTRQSSLNHEDPGQPSNSSDESDRRLQTKKSKNATKLMSTQQQQELDQMIAKIRARPGQNKSLYILRREGRNDNTVQTRSGRVSVKPLAYWKNERCVYGGSPSGVTLEDGARFPLNSIKEIIRTEEHASKKSKKGKKPNQRNLGSKKAGQSATQKSETTDSSDDEFEDPEAEAWETEKGTIAGPVSIWDQEFQVPIREEEDVDIAYSAGAIQTKDVSGSDFRYAKLLSTRFFGSGLVELPGGATKKPKNSRRMQMTFFVSKGRVTVSVGPEGQEPTKFSIGKGGFWQVPRGNQYSIENEHEKTALIFFSQGCEIATPVESYEN